MRAPELFRSRYFAGRGKVKPNVYWIALKEKSVQFGRLTTPLSSAAPLWGPRLLQRLVRPAFFSGVRPDRRSPWLKDNADEATMACTPRRK